MYLGAYRFTGDPDALLAGYDRLMAAMADQGASLLLHACVADGEGITVLDACPSREVFEGFSASAEFAGALAAAGLPSPVVDQLGEVHAARLLDAALP